MKQLLLGEFIVINKSNICPDYPLKDFISYKEQERDNDIKSGTVISIYSLREIYWYLIEKDNKVIVISNF